MTRLARWLIPLASVPMLALLAYGFRVNPREVPSPLVGRLPPASTLKTFEGAENAVGGPAESSSNDRLLRARFIDRQSRIRAKHVGVITDEAFRRYVEPLLQGPIHGVTRSDRPPGPEAAR